MPLPRSLRSYSHLFIFNPLIMKFNSKTITLTTNAKDGLAETKIRAEALAILLGEFNKYGREAFADQKDYEKLQEDKQALENIIYRTEQALLKTSDH